MICASLQNSDSMVNAAQNRLLALKNLHQDLWIIIVLFQDHF
jgi:hypothetical protein